MYVRAFSLCTIFAEMPSTFSPSALPFFTSSFFDSYGHIQGGEGRLFRSALRALCRLPADSGKVSRVGDGDYLCPNHERRVRGGPGVPEERAGASGNLSGTGLECRFQVARDDGHGENDFRRDEHAGVISPDDDAMRSFSSQKSENDGTDGGQLYVSVLSRILAKLGVLR
jgi:hypothetical protein